MVDLIIYIKTLKQFYKLKQFKKETDVIKSFEVLFEVIENEYLLTYSICGDISEIIIPVIEYIPKSYKRHDELWKTTCFELFLGSKKHRKYIEVNLSSDYKYNIYSFDDYRSNMKEERSMILKSIKNNIAKQKLTLNYILKSKKVININDLRFNITAVIKYKNQKIEYWAINHNKEKADFHDFYSFTKFN